MDSSFPRLHFRGYIQSRLGVTLLCLLVVFFAAAPLPARPAPELHTTTTTTATTSSWGSTHIGLPSTLPQATTGVTYSTVLTPTGGASPYSFSLTGLLPAGLSLNSATGAISGIPTVAGTFYFRVGVSDQQGDRGDKRLSIVVRSGGTPITLQLSPTTASLSSGGNQQFSATVTGTSNTAVTWSASAGSISSTGLFTAPIVQTTSAVTVTARSQASLEARASAPVSVAPSSAPQISVQISPTSASLSSGSSQQFIASVTGTSNTTVTWSASAGSISSTGFFTAPVVQTTSAVTVTASSQASLAAKASATVNIAPATPGVTVRVNPGATALVTGGSFQFTATVSGTSNPGVTWSAALGTISQAGLYVAPSSTGTDTIRAVSQADSTKYATSTASISSTPPNPGSSGADNRYCSAGGTWIGATTDGPANLPTACNNTALANTPSPGTLWGPDSTTAAVQNDLNAAACGDTIQIASGVTIGALTLPAKGCDNAHWITLESSGVSNAGFPAEGTRATPCLANLASLPNRPAYACPSPAPLMANIQQPSVGVSGPLHFAAGANHYRLIGLEISRTSASGIVYDMVDMTPCSSGVCVNHIILDRVYCHGVEGTFPQSVSTATETKRCVNAGQANHVAVIDSYLANFYCDGSLSACDAQAIAGGWGSLPNSGWGVIKIVNNHLEGAAEGILFGGSSGPALTPAGCTAGVNCSLDVPTDGEVRSNYFFKPQSWKLGGTSSTTGWPLEKNGFEMKIGARWLFEGNVIEGTWPMGQIGQTIVLAPKNPTSGGTSPHGIAPTALTNDMTYRYIYAYNVAAGIGLFSTQDNGCTTCQSQGANRVSVHDLVIDWINLPVGASQSQGDATEYIANQGSPLQNFSITHMTISTAIRSAMVIGGAAGEMINWTIQNNIVPNGNFGAVGAGGCNGSLSTATAMLNACLVPNAFDHNAIMGGTATGWPTTGGVTGNWFPSTSTVGFVNFNGGSGGDYHLSSSSPYKYAGSDGKDIGADIDTIASETAGVAQ